MTRTGKVWPDSREKKRRRFAALLEFDNGFLPLIECKKFSTRRAATMWLQSRGVDKPRQY